MKYRLGLDIAMASLMIPVLAERATGFTLHLYLGIVLFILYILHIASHVQWYRRLLTGKYPLQRKIDLISNLCLTLSFSIVLFTGICLIPWIHHYLPAKMIPFIRQAHYLSAYWFMIFVGIHIGLHWQIVLTRFRNFLFHGKTGRLLTAVIVLSGLYSSVITGIYKALFGWQRRLLFPPFWRTHDALIFFAFSSMIGLWAVIGYWIRRYHIKRKFNF